MYGVRCAVRDHRSTGVRTSSSRPSHSERRCRPKTPPPLPAKPAPDPTMTVAPCPGRRLILLAVRGGSLSTAGMITAEPEVALSAALNPATDSGSEHSPLTG